MEQTPIVIAPDVVFDLILERGSRGRAAAALFDAIAADAEARNDQRPAYIAPLTLPMVHYRAVQNGGSSVAASITSDLLRLVIVPPLVNEDYLEALRFFEFEFEDAIQFATCRRVGAKYLVTGNDFGGKRAPVHRRTAAEIMPVFRKG